MKKIVTSLLALTLVFALVLTGCGKKESSNPMSRQEGEL